MINRFDSKHKINLSSNQTLWKRLKMVCFCSFYTFGENISLLTFKPLMQLHRGFKARYVTLAENFTTTMCSRTVRARHVDFQLTHRKNCFLRGVGREGARPSVSRQSGTPSVRCEVWGTPSASFREAVKVEKIKNERMSTPGMGKSRLVSYSVHHKCYD